MQEPKKPKYSEEELESVRLKLNEYEEFKNNEAAIQQYIYNNLSDKERSIKRKKEKKDKISSRTDNLMFYLYLIVLIIVVSILVYNGEFKTTEKKIVAFLYYLFIGGIVGLPIFGIAFSLIFLPFNYITSKIFNSPFEKLHEKESILRNEYQTALLQKYNKYFDIQKELDDYQIKLKEYQAYILRTQKEFWYSLDGHAFEQEIAKIFRKEGFVAKVSKVGADGGIDIIVSKNNKRYAVQCKAHTSKISESVARDLYGVLHSRNFDGGYLITLNGTSSKTKEFCKKNKDKPIIIWTIYDILKKSK